jgi:hypothetical protein
LIFAVERCFDFSPSITIFFFSKKKNLMKFFLGKLCGDKSFWRKKVFLSLLSLRSLLSLLLHDGALSQLRTKTSQELRIAALRVVSCQGVKVFLLKDVIITTSVTTVIFITITV